MNFQMKYLRIILFFFKKECFETCATCKTPDKCDSCHKDSNREGGKNKEKILY